MVLDLTTKSLRGWGAGLPGCLQCLDPLVLAQLVAHAITHFKVEVESGIEFEGRTYTLETF